MSRSEKVAPERPPFLSSARLSGVLFRIPCQRAPLEDWLAHFGPLTLGESGDTRGQKYPVYCEMWRVHDGGLRVGDMDQHALSELGGAAMGAWMGAFADSWINWLPGRVRQKSRSGSGTNSRVTEGAEFGSRVLPSLSRAAAKRMGTYHETMAWIPDVRVAGSTERHSFVIGMLSDSNLARWADKAFGYGYDKQRGRFHVPSPTEWQVWNGAQPMLAFSGTRQGARGADFAQLNTLNTHLSAPLLGVNRSGDLALSWLDRSFATASNVRELSGVLQISPRMLPGCSDRYSLPRPRAGSAWHVLEFENLKAEVSYPYPLRLRR